MQQYTKSVLLLLAGAALISFSPVFVKYAALEGLGTTAIAFWRVFLGGLVLFGVAALRGSRLALPKQAIFYAMLAGAFFCVDLFSWHRSIVYAGAGMSTMLANTQVFAAAIISFFVFKERPSVTFFVAAIVAFIGVVMLVGVFSEEVVLSGTYLTGVIYGLITGVAYANYIVSLKKGQVAVQKPDPVVFVAYASVFSALFLGVVGVVEGSNFQPTTISEVLALLGLVLLVQALGWLLISSNLPHVVTAQAGLILLLQPILAMTWGAILFAEYLDAVQIIGAVVTLIAMYFGITRRETERATEKGDFERSRLDSSQKQ